MIRTHDAGSLRASHAGQTVTLAGWVARRRDHGGVIFVDLRDASGVVQVVFREEDAHALRNEFCVKVTGEVTQRPAGNENPDLPTGAVEVTATELVVLSEAAPLPLPVDDTITASDDLRLKYRYLDLRRSGPANALKLRSRANQIAREVLHARDFNEIETPTLTRSTPEGARDFLVPVRLQPGTWYALPQSPQLFKQLLMVAGMERYYQIARCYRDEDFRADRQPEFTQLDIEMSFVTQDDIIELGEEIVVKLWGELAGYTGADADPADHLARRDEPVRLRQARPALRRRADRADRLPARHRVPGVRRRDRRRWLRRRGRHAGRRLADPQGAGRLAGLGQGARRPRPGLRGAGRRDRRGPRPGRQEPVRGAPGRARRRGRRQAGRRGVLRRGHRAPRGAGTARRGPHRDRQAVRPDRRVRLGVLLGRRRADVREDATSGGWTAVHHPFTSPNAEWMDSFESAPDQALAYAYDIVFNGNEIGGGSVRIHRGDVQSRVFDLLGIIAGGGAGQVRLPAGGVQVRPAAARRHRARLGPDLHAALRQRVDPRGHRVPEDPRRLRPADRRADADHRPAAAGGRHRRQAEGRPTATPGTDGVAAPVEPSN